MLGICVRTDAQLEDLCRDDTIFAALGEGGIFIVNATHAGGRRGGLSKRDVRAVG